MKHVSQAAVLRMTERRAMEDGRLVNFPHPGPMAPIWGAAICTHDLSLYRDPNWAPGNLITHIEVDDDGTVPEFRDDGYKQHMPDCPRCLMFVEQALIAGRVR